MISGFLQVLFFQAATNQVELKQNPSKKSTNKPESDKFVKASEDGDSEKVQKEKVARGILEKFNKLKKKENKSKSDNLGDIEGPDTKKKPPDNVKSQTEEIKKTNKNEKREWISANHYKLSIDYPDENKHVDEEYKNGKLVSRKTNNFDYTKVIEETWESGTYTKKETEYESKTFDKKRVLTYINEKKKLEEIFEKSNFFPSVKREYDSSGNLSTETKFAKYLSKEYIKDFSKNLEFYFNPETDRHSYTVKKNANGAVETLWMYKLDGVTAYMPRTIRDIAANVSTVEEFNIINGFIRSGDIKFSRQELSMIQDHGKYLNSINNKIKEIKEKYDVQINVNPPLTNGIFGFTLLPPEERLNALNQVERFIKMHPRELYEGYGLSINFYSTITDKRYGSTIAGLGDISLASAGMNQITFDHELTHYFDDDSMDEAWMGIFGGKDKYPGNKDFNKFYNENYSVVSGFPTRYAMVNCTEHRAVLGELILNPEKIGEVLSLKENELYSKDSKTLQLAEQLIYMFEQKSKGMMDRQYFKDLIKYGNTIDWNKYFENKRNKMRAIQQILKKAA